MWPLTYLFSKDLDQPAHSQTDQSSLPAVRLQCTCPRFDLLVLWAIFLLFKVNGNIEGNFQIFWLLCWLDREPASGSISPYFVEMKEWSFIFIDRCLWEGMKRIQDLESWNTKSYTYDNVQHTKTWTLKIWSTMFMLNRHILANNALINWVNMSRVWNESPFSMHV